MWDKVLFLKESSVGDPFMSLISRVSALSVIFFNPLVGLYWDVIRVHMMEFCFHRNTDQFYKPTSDLFSPEHQTNKQE